MKRDKVTNLIFQKHLFAKSPFTISVTDLLTVLALSSILIIMPLFLITLFPTVYATHAVDPVPAAGDQNTLFQMQSIAALDPSAPEGTDIYVIRTFVLYDPDLGASIPNLPIGANSCENYTPDVGDRLWELQNTGTGQRIESSHDNILSSTSSIFWDSTAIAGNGFGNGAIPAAISTTGAATIYFANEDPSLNNWAELDSAGNPTGNFDSTAQSGQYLLVACGWTDVNSDGIFGGVGVEPITVETRGFIVNPSGPDVDGDEILDEDDNCPFISNPDQEDTDGNGIGDACQDVDGDEILDINDNCRFIPNTDQEDTNENGIGNACEDQTELLVDATFPPGDKIIVELPEDPETGTFSISLELPETQGGDVLIETTDAGKTPGNFSFLGFIIDFNAPCTGVCEISFTFTQASLDEQGITLEEVTIFHDINENGSFENNEAIPTIITGSDPFTATASASFTSKFSVGGIKALALGALGGGSSRGGSPPTLENLSFDGVSVINEDGTIGFGGLVIDEILEVNELPTQTIETGVPFELRFPFYEDNGVGAIRHIGIHFLQDDDKKIYDSDFSIIYEPGKDLKISDSHGYTSDVSVEVIEKTANDIDIIFEMTFLLSLEPTDVIVRSWDSYKRSSDFRFNNLIQVVELESKDEFEFNTLSNETSWEKTIESSTTKSTTIFEFKEYTSVDMENGRTVLQNPKIPLWVKNNANWWSQEKINDDDFVAGIQYLTQKNIMVVPERHIVSILEIPPPTNIPDWIKNNAAWWAEGFISDREFVQSIQWLIEKGIVTI